MKLGAFWDKNPSQFGEAVGALVYERSRNSTLAIFNHCVSASPVDSGAYRASWHISEGSPEYKWVGRQPRNSTPLPPPLAPKLSTKFYRKFYVTNGAPYASKLEYGWSDQAPQGVLRQAMRYGV
jgi:hypothetical protein